MLFCEERLEHQMNKKEAYLDLLSKTYDEAVKFLLDKYGPAQDDYYKENSYTRFMNGKIKNISRGKYSRTSEGLYCHHIDENIFLNISNKSYIKRQEIPFKYQKKERLVYCDLIEHNILHALITKETEGKYGYPGYSAFLSPMIEEWYLQKKLPKPSWMLKCYHKAYVTPEEAFELLKSTNEVISDKKDLTLSFSLISSSLDGYDHTFPDTLDDYYKLEKERQELEELRRKYHAKKEKKRRNKKESILSKAKNIDSNSPSHEIVQTMYGLLELGAYGYSHLFSKTVYSKEYKMYIKQAVDFKDFESGMEKYDLSGIVKNINLYIDYEEGFLDRDEYYSLSRKYSKTKE